MEDGQILSWFEGTMEGRGIHKGLIARCWYSGVDVMGTGKLQGRGYVVERGAPVRPFNVRGTRTDSFIIVPGIYIVPFTEQTIPGSESMIAYWEIQETAENVSHLGKTKEFGFGMSDLFGPDPRGTGMGYTLAPNGDKLYWVANVDVNPGGINFATFNFAGGTGRLEAAFGGFEGEVEYQITTPDEEKPLEQELNLTYEANGSIRY